MISMSFSKDSYSGLESVCIEVGAVLAAEDRPARIGKQAKKREEYRTRKTLQKTKLHTKKPKSVDSVWWLFDRLFMNALKAPVGEPFFEHFSARTD